LNIDDRTAWVAFAAGAATFGGAAMRKALEQAWKLAMDEDPPLDPSASDVPWREAIIWTVATGALIGLGRLIARRGAAAGWQRLTGHSPPF
jgi:hypothetical protein